MKGISLKTAEAFKFLILSNLYEFGFITKIYLHNDEIVICLKHQTLLDSVVMDITFTHNLGKQFDRYSNISTCYSCLPWWWIAFTAVKKNEENIVTIAETLNVSEIYIE